MGQGGSITFVNGTNCDWQSSDQRSYQMNAWNFPTTISAGTAISVYVEWCQNILDNQNDDSAVVTYTLAGTNQSFQLVAGVPNGNFDLEVVLTSLSTEGNPQGSIINLGWNWNGTVNFILAGTPANLVSSNPPTGWMQANLGSLGGRTLRQLCMPGSHDAGMSQFNGGTAFASRANTQTQTLGILGQLQCGSRYFDIRPVIAGGQYYTGHYGPVPVVGQQGANGQSISSIVSDINTYTANNQELVILYLSHDMETDTGYGPFSQANWDGLFSLLSGLDNLFEAPNPTTVDLTQLTLSQFIGGRAAVVVVVDPNDSAISLGDFASRGFYQAGNFNVVNQYSDKDDLPAMAADQLSKLAANRPNPDASYFLLSWTLTQNGSDAIGGPSILDLAATADSAIYSQVLPACSAQTYPNILYIDNLCSSDIAALAMAVNCNAIG